MVMKTCWRDKERKRDLKENVPRCLHRLARLNKNCDFFPLCFSVSKHSTINMY